VADEALTDLLVAELSQQEQVEILERRQLQMVLGELSLTALIDDAWRQTRPGKLLGVDAFAWVRLRGDRAVLEAIAAGRFKKLTPSAVFALVVNISSQGDPEMTPYLKALADEILSPPADWDDSRTSALSNLKANPHYLLATDLIARLRTQPDAPFEYPFDNR
jgi:hypothetical protein